jgi:hypothetical protein
MLINIQPLNLPDNELVKFPAAYAGRALAVNFSGSRTVHTMHLKSLATIPDYKGIDQTVLSALNAGGIDTYVNIGGIPCLFTSGVNGYTDEVMNELWLKFALQTAGYNYLRATNTKIPQTELGMEGLKNEYRKVMEQAVSNGFLAAGAWTSSEFFGDPVSLVRSVKDIGYYVYSQPVSQQLMADRIARKAPLIQIAAKTAGAIHSSNVIVNVNI